MDTGNAWEETTGRTEGLLQVQAVVMLLETTESPGTPTKSPRGTDSPSGSSDITMALGSLSTFWLSCLSTGSIHTDPIHLPAPLGTLTSLNPSHHFYHTAKYTQELNFIDLLGPTWPIPKLIALVSHDSLQELVTGFILPKPYTGSKTEVQSGRGAGNYW